MELNIRIPGGILTKCKKKKSKEQEIIYNLFFFQGNILNRKIWSFLKKKQLFEEKTYSHS